MIDFGTHEYSGGKCPFLNTDTILRSIGIFILSADGIRPYLNDVDIISGFILGTSKSPSGFLVIEVVRNHCHSPQVVQDC